MWKNQTFDGASIKEKFENQFSQNDSEIILTEFLKQSYLNVLP